MVKEGCQKSTVEAYRSNTIREGAAYNVRQASFVLVKDCEQCVK